MLPCEILGGVTAYEDALEQSARDQRTKCEYNKGRQQRPRRFVYGLQFDGMTMFMAGIRFVMRAGSGIGVWKVPILFAAVAPVKGHQELAPGIERRYQCRG